MSEPITLRFDEFQRYDIQHDAEVVTFMAITNVGTYNGTVQVTENEPGKLRAFREQFKTYVFQCIENGVPPHEASMDDDDEEAPGTDASCL